MAVAPLGGAVAALLLFPRFGFPGAFTALGSAIAFALLVALQSHLQLRADVHRMELIVEATHDSIWEWDLTTGRLWRGGKLFELYGISPEQVEPTVEWWRHRLHPEDEKRVWDALQAAIESGDSTWRDEYRLRHASGEYRTIADRAVIIRDRQNRPVRLLGGTIDVSARRRVEELLVHNAFHDPLTGLPNRELFLDRLDRALSRLGSGEGSPAIAVLFLDVDRFKVINDSLGHTSGDELLAALGARLKRHLRHRDTAARFGGDEFTVLLDGLDDATDALRIAERIQRSISIPFNIGPHQVPVSVSIGVACASSDAERPEDILRQADLAMYRAKAGGRARAQLFEPSFDVHARSILQRESELRESFHNGSLQLYYQPIVSLESGRTVSFEALLRWNHPSRGLILPSEILPLAHEAGLGIQLGTWVLRECCHQLRRWRDAGLAPSSLSLSFNLSGTELMRPTLLDEVSRLLTENRLEGTALLIELTETTIMEGDALAVQTLTRLRDLGVRLALDDFGCGYSSLARLQDFPISMIKIDSSFVEQIGGPKQKILAAIVALAHELKIEITAEGVETFQQLQYLVECGASRVQGLLFSDALSVQAAEHLLAGSAYWPAVAQYLGRASHISAR